MSQFQHLINELKAFRDAREWAQFHDPRNLALALSIEAAELNELFLWKKGEDASSIDPQRLREELADVLAYALLMADRCGFDVEEIVLEKINKNEQKYPVEKAKGSAEKYNRL
jgi:NTP pyrophosphatase (non-canonical NTP hydrolase)